MNSIKTKIRKLKFKLKHDFLGLPNVVLAISVILCFTWTFQTIKAMTRSWELSERLAAERKTLELLTVEVETAELENEYYQSGEYLELLARRQLDKKMPGENMVVMPPNSDAAKTKHQETAAEIVPKKYSNFEKWMAYLFPNY